MIRFFAGFGIGVLSVGSLGVGIIFSVQAYQQALSSASLEEEKSPEEKIQQTDILLSEDVQYVVDNQSGQKEVQGDTFSINDAFGAPLGYAPDIIRAVYLTSWSASSSAQVDYAISLAKNTDINAVVIDIKDYSGIVSYNTSVLEAEKYGAEHWRIRDMTGLIERLHKEGIYVIARITVFQDPILAVSRPSLAVHSVRGLNKEAFEQVKQDIIAANKAQESEEAGIGVSQENDKEEQMERDAITQLLGQEGIKEALNAENLTAATIWRDNKELPWMDPSAKEVWEYNIAIAKDAISRGFDEINFDYIRFPSDGILADMSFPVWDREAPRSQVIQELFQYVSEELSGTPISVDLFGLTTVQADDLGIGQLIETAYGNFDYVSPMVYPSHYAPGFRGFANPTEHPYEVVEYSMRRAEERLNLFVSANEMSRPTKLRPWLQDFSILGVDYGMKEVGDQIQATKDALEDNYVGYMLWSPRNIYTEAAL